MRSLDSSRVLLVLMILAWPTVAIVRYWIARRGDRLRHRIGWSAPAVGRRVRMEYQWRPGDCDPWAPVVYLFTIFRPGEEQRYVGSAANGARRAIETHARAVERLLAGDTTAAGRVHYALADAVRNGWPIELRLLENPAPDADLGAAQSDWARRVDARLNDSGGVRGRMRE